MQISIPRSTFRSTSRGHFQGRYEKDWDGPRHENIEAHHGVTRIAHRAIILLFLFIATLAGVVSFHANTDVMEGASKHYTTHKGQVQPSDYAANHEQQEDEVALEVDDAPSSPKNTSIDDKDKLRNEFDGKNIFQNVDHFCSLPLVSSGKEAFSNLKPNSGPHPTLENSSAHKIWHHFIPNIFHHSLNQDDIVWHDFIHMLLDFVTPRMKNTVKNLPVRYWDSVGHVMDLAFKRYKYIKTEEKDTQQSPREVRVLIIGGSVTEGVNCAAYPLGVDGRPSYKIRTCAWAQRLMGMVNDIVGKCRKHRKLFNFQLVAMGGWNSRSAMDIIKYDILNDDNHPYDIIVNTFAPNDMHIISMNEAAEKNATLADSLFEVSQEFIRTILEDYKRCKGRKLPLVLYYNDYLGNEQKGIMDIDSYSRVMNTLTSYYGIGQISYVDLVRHTVLGDTNETWFSPNDWPDRQIHPGRGFHIITPWVFMYYFLEMSTTYCDMMSTNMLPRVHHPADGSVLRYRGEEGRDSKWTSGYDHIEGLPSLIKNTTSMPKLPRLPMATPIGLPPVLNANLTLDNISQQWRDSEAEAIRSEEAACPEGDKTVSPCVFAFVSALTTPRLEEVFKRKLSKHMTHNDGWEIREDHRKLGYVATTGNATFTIEMDIPSSQIKPVRVFKLLSMKSYGEKWEGSEVRMTVSIMSSARNHTASMNVLGIHDKNTSETYTHALVLEDDQVAMPNDHLKVQLHMIGGTTFKITGMMFCDH